MIIFKINRKKKKKYSLNQLRGAIWGIKNYYLIIILAWQASVIV